MPRLTRRRALVTLCAAMAPMTAPLRARATTRPAARPDAAAHRVAAAWDDVTGGHHIGILGMAQSEVRVLAAVEVPTRAHALEWDRDGSVLAVARRPGEWLLRWRPELAPADEAQQWHWVDYDGRLNGHVIGGADGSSLLTTETDLQSGGGWLVRRERTSLAVTDRWSTHGMDPHAMLLLPDGRLLVANGGIATRPETGRAGLARDRMDSSLVLLSPSDGSVHGVWRLPDRRLSLRHLAWHASGRVAVAMQAWHDDARQRANAPVLALLDLQHADLRVVQASRGVAGYAGDVAAVGGHWFVSCPRADTLLRVALDGSQATRLTLGDACALAGSADQSWGWASGRDAAWQLGSGRIASAGVRIRLDNHARVR